MCDQDTKRGFRSIKIEVAILILINVAAVIWGAAVLHTRVNYLEEQASQGDRFTADDGRELADALVKLTENVGILYIWRAEVESHIKGHNDSAAIWIDIIKKNQKTLKELHTEVIEMRAEMHHAIKGR